MLLLLLVPLMALASQLRLVYRQSCSRHNTSTGDEIGCAEETMRPMEHVLTPRMLWCNSTVCSTRSQQQFDVHAIDCTTDRCNVLLHCAERADDAKLAVGATAAGVVVVIMALFCRPRNAPPHAEKSL